jgi:hypothetical protein
MGFAGIALDKIGNQDTYPILIQEETK